MPTVHTLVITLRDDAVFSRSNATAGAHDTLTRIPGSALLGAAAARLYRQLGAERAFLAFHSGKLRFGDGWPLADDGIVALPAPQCLHRPKEGAWMRDGRIEAERVLNFQHAEGFENNLQPRQLRDGYLTPDGRWVEPQARHRLKTAIDPTQGRAKEGQLFGYSALQSGQRFAAELHADDDFPDDLLREVLDALQGRVLLGRSRSAEYGAASITAHSNVPALRRDSQPLEERALSLWLLADLAPADEHGALPGALGAAALGLPAGCEIDWSRSFARARRYSAWNAHRHGYEPERWVLEAGGVLRITLPAGFSADDRAALCQTVHDGGLGLGREAGLGQVWADAPLLAQAKPQFADASAASRARLAVQTAAADQPASGYAADLLAWLSADRQHGDADLLRDIARFLDEYRQAVETGRRAAGIAASACDYAPSRSQWGTVYERLRQRNVQVDALFDSQNGVIKDKAKGWKLEIPLAKRRISLAEWIKERWSDSPWGNDPSRLAQLVWHLKQADLSASPARQEREHV